MAKLCVLVDPGAEGPNDCCGSVNRLIALLDGQRVGTVEQLKGGELSFTYSDEWRALRDAYPLSLSMPIGRQDHSDPAVRAFLEGLLPDNRDVLRRWGREFHVSPRNPFALLTHMGEDCAGAVQFTVPERASLLVAAEGDVEWLSEEDIAARLEDLIESHGTGRLPTDHGQFSLAGAQPKTALFQQDGRWGIPSGAVPTTHILKPPAQRHFDSFEINEHFCLNLAARLGLAAAKSSIKRFGDHSAIVVERYDRRRVEGGRVLRVHQEDACQALAVPPWTKYENEGGPGVPQIVDLLLRESSDPAADVGAFIDAIVLNWVIAGTDGHAKNYSVLISPYGVRLAPLYDLLCALPYDREIPYRKAKLAMRIDREYHLWKIRGRHWTGLAARCDLDPQPLLQRTAELLMEIPTAAAETAEIVRRDGFSGSFLDRLEEAIVDHSVECLNRLD